MAEFIIGKDATMASLNAFLMGLNMARKWSVTIEPVKNSRSIQQNRLYQKWLGIIAQETGNNRSAVRAHCLSEFLDPVVTEFNGKVTVSLRSTADLKVDEMAEYMTRVHAWAAADLDIRLPVPEELHEVRR